MKRKVPMEKECLQKLLLQVSKGSVSVAHAFEKLKDLPFEDLGFAHIDHHRAIRKGYPEVIFCQNKTPQQVTGIALAQIRHGETVFGTRANRDVLSAVTTEIPGAEIDETARCFWKKSKQWKKKRARGSIVICSAGTADLPVVQEAKATVEILGHTPIMLKDVGVAGIHRLFSHRETLRKAAVIIAVAGMEGALPSVIAGYVSCPVIGVPTSVGYGSHLGGMVPLFAMLNSCATGLTVVNIDNGFGAACAAAGIVTR
ncbi:MAG: nickel pincer cofactor biosynthesis protein LarB [Chitinispirillaceae bacterium]|nr:nickel pincer cofactor biosynthesis protein LarB [Chitinispirillaceae bacterium]